MNKPTSDKYEFIYPNYSLTKSNYFNSNIFDNLEFTSSGNQKKYSTNISEIENDSKLYISGFFTLHELSSTHSTSSDMINPLLGIFCPEIWLAVYVAA